MQWGPNGTTIAQDWQQRQIGKKSPSRRRSGRGEGCHSSHPSQGASEDRHLNSVRPVCGGSAKPRQKDGPDVNPGPGWPLCPSGGKTQQRWAPAASARFVAGLWPRQDTFKDPGTAPGNAHAICVRPPIPDPIPNAQVICKKSWRIGHRSADLISAAAHVPARA